MTHSRLSGEEVESRGQELDEQAIRAKVEPDNDNKICMIDVETGEYQIGETMLDAGEPLLARNSDAALWAVRIGHELVYSFGASLELFEQ
jgi:hypothetical protein